MDIKHLLNRAMDTAAVQAAWAELASPISDLDEVVIPNGTGL